LIKPTELGDTREEQEDAEGWQKLIIPVDLPFMHVSISLFYISLLNRSTDITG
jgi:hypothetical protein